MRRRKARIRGAVIPLYRRTECDWGSVKTVKSRQVTAGDDDLRKSVGERDGLVRKRGRGLDKVECLRISSADEK